MALDALALHHLAKSYPTGGGLRPTTLSLEPGDRLALLGPSGSGKSTLLRLIAGLEDPDAGEIHVGGVRVDRLPPHRRGVALLPQRPALYPHLTVKQNLELSSQFLVSGSHYLELLRLGQVLDRRPDQLSGGERQRVALAKVLTREAGVWLLDEPFGPLDPVFRTEFRFDLHLLLDHTPATMILVTHDPIDALALGRRLGVLGDGQLQQLGTAEQLRDRPGNRFVASCLGQLSLIDGRAGGGERSGDFVSDCGAVSVPLRSGLDTADNLTLGIRPEDVFAGPPAEPSRPGAALTGWPVVSAEPVGSGWWLTVARGRTRVRVGWPSGSPPPVGTPVDLFLPADKCHWFNGRTGQRIDVSP